ncbi:hypothetical protein SAMN05421819_2357 [Bryocella elongata]|uniref:Uncharacterized protein n=1 Tax=Bryocella elongata TaxID=863522 RepID=A0A1H5YJY9_9BACT|nr:hypothetical protein SAMN05421819_2357 [Bryocella elongata]
MPSNLLLRHPPNSWRGFLLRVVIIAIAAGIVLGVADWFGISLDPMNRMERARPHLGPDSHYAAPTSSPEP